MGSIDAQHIKLPVIDFSVEGGKMNPKSPEWAAIQTQVRRALEEFGCFEARFDGVPMDARNTIMSSAQELFNLPLETKLRNLSSKPYEGYLGQIPQLPRYESMGMASGFGGPEMQENVEAFFQSMWPDQGHPTFSKAVQSWFEGVLTMEQMIKRMVLESFGLEKHIEEHLDAAVYQIRIIKYKGQQPFDTNLGLAPHTDKGTLTVLYSNQVEGLQIQTKDGEWIQLKPSPESFTVIMGDTFHAWANGRLHNPIHSVMLSGSDERYTIVLFSGTKDGYLVNAPDELVDEEHPRLFRPFYIDEYLKFVDNNAAVQNPLKVYCGV